MARTLCLILAVALLPRPAAAGLTVQQQIVRIPAGAVIQVQLRDKSRIHGRLGAVANDGFEVLTAETSTVTMQRLRFDQVRSIRERDLRPLGARKPWVGIVIAASFAGLLFLPLAVIRD